jgi:Tol biopolymer transport system component
MRRRLAPVVGLLAALLAVHLPAAAQSPPPDADWYTFTTDHFRVVYHDGLEDLARHAAAVAERTYALLSAELVRPPRGPIDMVVTDHVDFSNGFATPFTSNRIVVFARPPAMAPSLAFSRDWLELVVAHELVHIFHLDPAGAVGRAVRSVLGRVPMVWPLFPALGTPIWNVEGLATYYESRLTGGGRVHGTYHDMVIRTAALEAEIPPLRLVSAPSPVWPGAERSYIYGAALMAHIAREYGPEAHADIVDATYGSVLPTFLFVDHVARRAVGRSFSAIYGDWRAAATDSAHALRDRLTAQGLTRTDTVVGYGPITAAPRLSPDGSSLTYASHDYRSEPATRLLDLATGEISTLARRNQFGWILGPASWLPDGQGLVAAQLEYQGRHRLYSDLWILDTQGRERRLTRGERLASPHVAADGRRVAAVQHQDGATHLVEHHITSGETRVIARAAPGDAFHAPRWSPDGGRIAATLYMGGQVNVVVVDPATGRITTITRDDALDGMPAWSPDGRWIVFWSDRTGIPNLFAAPVPTPDASDGPGQALFQVTNMLGGAIDPEISPDGRSIYFASHHYEGWHLERIPFDTTTWREAPPSVVRYQEGLLLQAPPVATGPATPYSPLPTLRPYFWGPTYQSMGNTQADQWSRFIGAFSMGWDLLQRHSWTGSAAYDIDTGRAAGALAWTWSGLGTADIGVRGARDWSGAGRIALPDESFESVLLREDRIGVDAVFYHRQWRRSAWLGFGAGLRQQEYQTYSLTEQELAGHGFRLRDLPTTASLTIRPGFSNVSMHPYSISWQDGITASMGAGRWWNLDDRTLSYDQLQGAISGFRGYRLWGFADHVVAVRMAGLRRSGPDAQPTSIGGPPGGVPDFIMGTGSAAAFLPVRGFQLGDRIGTRAWTTSAEYRFPLHMRGAPHLIGFSLTSVAGTLFADIGNAWCTPVEQQAEPAHGCPLIGESPLASVGAEIAINLGILHNFPLTLRWGLALPLSGPADGVAHHVGFGPSF